MSKISRGQKCHGDNFGKQKYRIGTTSKPKKLTKVQKYRKLKLLEYKNAKKNYRRGRIQNIACAY